MNITKLMTMKYFYFLVIKYLLTKHDLRNTTLGHILWQVSESFVHGQGKINREDKREMPPARKVSDR